MSETNIEFNDETLETESTELLDLRSKIEELTLSDDLKKILFLTFDYNQKLLEEIKLKNKDNIDYLDTHKSLIESQNEKHTMILGLLKSAELNKEDIRNKMESILIGTEGTAINLADAELKKMIETINFVGENLEIVLNEKLNSINTLIVGINSTLEDANEEIPEILGNITLQATNILEEKTIEVQQKIINKGAELEQYLEKAASKNPKGRIYIFMFIIFLMNLYILIKI